jgi:UDP-N-acetyl-D-mannosaminuronic acid dehydrogenase
MFASKEKNVIGVDINEKAVALINDGKIHIVEPGLDDIVESAVSDGFLRAAISSEPADAFIVAVPTPFMPHAPEDLFPMPDLSYIKAAAKSISKVLKSGDLVILESTVPVGATEQMAEWLAEQREDLTFPHTHGESSDIRIAHCPERVLPGQVIKELVQNDRVIGGITKKCSEIAIDLYKTFVEGDFIVTNSHTAEMAKLTENASRDTGIAFANELSVVCDHLGINVWELIDIANKHPRVNILQPGPGVGGHCIAVDPWFIVSKTPELTPLIRAARRVNDTKPSWVLEKVKIAITDLLQSNLSKKIGDVVIACYGLTFKPNIDDLRESPALKIAKNISEFHGGKTLFVEPHISELPSSMKTCELVETKLALAEADIHLLLVDHEIFKDNLPLNGKIIDTRGIWS